LGTRTLHYGSLREKTAILDTDLHGFTRIGTFPLSASLI